MKITTLRFLFGAFVATVLSLSASAQTSLGKIRIARVENEANKVAADGTSVALKNNDTVTENDTIKTGHNSSVVLAFENGSTVKLGADTMLAIETFKIDPLSETLNVATAKAEPTRSKTELKLSYGELVGDVKKLNTSSTYSIKTPVGAAGIRGTVFRIVFRPAADGKAFFTISTAEGIVVMEGVTAMEIPIEAGKEVIVEIDVPTTPGVTPKPPVILTQDLPEATKSAIQAATVTIIEMAQTFVPSSSPPPAETPPAETPKAEAPKAEPPQEPPPPTPPAPALTPGAGK